MKKLKGFEFSTASGRGSFYPWDEILDGSIWEINVSELRPNDSENNEEAFRRYRRAAYAAARSRDLVIQTQVDGDLIVVKAQPKE